MTTKTSWAKTAAPTNGLHAIGAPLRSTKPKRTQQCPTLPGSRPHRIVKIDKPAYEPKLTLCPGYPGYDKRVSCAPGEQPYGAGFAAAKIGRYIDTEA